MAVALVTCGRLRSGLRGAAPPLLSRRHFAARGVAGGRDPRAQLQATRSAAIEEDLRRMDELGPGKIDKQASAAMIKKWNLKAKISSGEVTRQDAFNMVRDELRAELNLAALQKAPVADQPSGSSQGSLKKVQAMAGVAALAAGGFGAWSYLSGATPLRLDASPPISGTSSGSQSAGASGSKGGTADASAGSGDAGGGSGSGKVSKDGGDAGKSTATAAAAGGRGAMQAPTRAKAETAAAQGSAAEAAGPDAAPPGEAGSRAAMYAVGGIAAAGIVFGLWWMLARGGPPNGGGSEAGNGHAGNGDAPLLPNEQVFENNPSESQKWDMSASIRGTPGSVKHRINQFSKK